jgi:hypothetical protein
MPKFKFMLFSERHKPVADRINTFILNGKQFGPIRNERDLKPTSKLLTVDAPPDKYELQLEIEGFKLHRNLLKITQNIPPEIKLVLPHRCTRLPAFDELEPAQQALLAAFKSNAPPEQTWLGLSDNQCATFFQLSHTLLQTILANGRNLASYVESVLCIGGVEIENTIPDGKKRTATGWRFHVTIREEDRPQIVADLIKKEVFGNQDGFVHPTHSKFGLIKSHRQRGSLPRLQVVLSADNSHADLDLDVEFDRSSPHDVFKHFIKKYPEVKDIYQF